MNRRSPLNTLREMAHERVDEATRRLGELMASEHAADAKLKLLADYRREYRERFLASARQGIDPRAWQNYTNFLGRLDEAIRAQEGLVANSRQATQLGQENWVEQNTRAKAFDTLNARHEKKEAQRQGKLEQRQSDEHAIKGYPRHED